jgi:enoyl-CoA hydratase
MPLSTESKMSEILGNEDAKALLDKHAPGLSSHPQISMAMGMSLKEVAGYPEAGISADSLAELDRDLGKLP